MILIYVVLGNFFRMYYKEGGQKWVVPVSYTHLKKYGLVFEEHREEIDEVLDSHTPVLNEEKDLFIDNGGQMNFLIEGDNLCLLYTSRCV